MTTLRRFTFVGRLFSSRPGAPEAEAPLAAMFATLPLLRFSTPPNDGWPW
jgi:hypothetical protein